MRREDEAEEEEEGKKRRRKLKASLYLSPSLLDSGTSLSG